MLVFIPQSRGTHQYLEGELQVSSKEEYLGNNKKNKHLFFNQSPPKSLGRRHRKQPIKPDLEDTCYFFCIPSVFCTSRSTTAINFTNTPKEDLTCKANTKIVESLLFSLCHTTSRHLDFVSVPHQILKCSYDAEVVVISRRYNEWSYLHTIICVIFVVIDRCIC